MMSCLPQRAVLVCFSTRSHVPCFSCEWALSILLLSVWGTIRQETQQPAIPAATNQAVSASIFLMKVANWDGKSEDIYNALTAAFDAKDYLNCIKDLPARNIEPLSYINNMDKVSSYSTSMGTLCSSRSGNRSSTVFEPTQICENDAYER